MTTNELISKLQEIDPSGNLEVLIYTDYTEWSYKSPINKDDVSIGNEYCDGYEGEDTYDENDKWTGPDKVIISFV